MAKDYMLVILIISLVMNSCQENNNHHISVSSKYEMYCGSCHLLPNPQNIPKHIWENGVLPEMASRMGLDYYKYRSNGGMSIQNDDNLKSSKAYSREASIDSLTWNQIENYILSLAPINIPLDSNRLDGIEKLNQFKIRSITLSDFKLPFITDVQFDSITSKFNIGDVTGRIQQWPNVKSSLKYNSAVTAINQKGSNLFVTEVGILNPSEIAQGVLSNTFNGTKEIIASALHRPVFTEIVDLNEDGEDEILICEFGHLTGELSLFEKNNGKYLKRTLLALPGAIKLEIADLNRDGKKDIIVLFSQGKEGIYVFYQKDNLKFDLEPIIQMPPEYGSSWFELVDYNKDGFLDVIYANGDNADYSIFPKPYHGIRVFLNDQKQNFTEKWFFPIYGATRVLAEDYDLDGDLDFAVTSFFNESEQSNGKSFFYLENKNSDTFDFETFTFKEDNLGWLVMDKGDYDQDGDIDIMLGSCNVEMLKKVNSSNNYTEIVNLLILENNAYEHYD